MGRTRLEAFSDGVLAIIITIMVLELKVPPHAESHAASLGDLVPLKWVFASYVLSFAFIGIYWNNHHHMMHTCTKVTGQILWANLHLLFWLSLVPFCTAWAGETGFATVPAAVYGVVFLAAGVAYYILQQRIIAAHGPGSPLKAMLGRDIKGRLSPVLYAAAIALAFVHPYISAAIYVGVALMWLVPDSRIESRL